MKQSIINAGFKSLNINHDGNVARTALKWGTERTISEDLMTWASALYETLGWTKMEAAGFLHYAADSILANYNSRILIEAKPKPVGSARQWTNFIDIEEGMPDPSFNINSDVKDWMVEEMKHHGMI